MAGKVTGGPPEIPKQTETQKVVDATIEQSQGLGWRRHLGASVIGRECPRQLWYIFHWARRNRLQARILRLFDRGNLEETRFVSWLRKAGVHVVDRDLETGEQLRITDHNDHFGGSLDAELLGLPDIPGEWGVGEFKTHNDKSFKALSKDGVKKAKPEHYAQMQIYMRKRGHRFAFYMAINKNDDDLYMEIVTLDEAFADGLLERAGRIIYAEGPPPRISESPGWYVCSWCDYKDVCHYGAPPALNCRTCVHAKPVALGQWLCGKYVQILTDDQQKQHYTCHEVYKDI